MPATLGMHSVAVSIMKNILMVKRQDDVHKNGVDRGDGTYDVWRLMITLHVEKLTSRRSTTSENPVVTDVGSQDIWRQTAPRRRTCATIVNGLAT